MLNASLRDMLASHGGALLSANADSCAGFSGRACRGKPLDRRERIEALAHHTDLSHPRLQELLRPSSVDVGLHAHRNKPLAHCQTPYAER
jgi:hypothetical protein